MKGLIYKDLLILGDSARIVLVLIFFCFFAIVFQTNVSLLTSMISLMLITTAVSSFSYDDLAHWNMYAMTFPCGRRKIVQSKYCLTLILMLVAMVLCFSFNVVPMLLGQTIQLEDVTLMCLIAIGLSGLLNMILIPFIFKFGAEKSRMMMIILIVIIYAIGFGGVSFLQKMQFTITLTTPMIMSGLIFFIVVGTFISYCCSLRVIEKKEF